MQEAYLHYLFKQKLLPNSYLTSKGEQIEVINRGVHNHNAGPDFLEGKIKFDGKVWAGHIEFHVKSSDWYKHNHQIDDNYNNVIVHFVYENDGPVFINNFEIPTIEIKEYVDHGHYQHYVSFRNVKDWIPCANQIQKVDPFYIFHQKEKALLNRLIRKSDDIIEDIQRYKGNQYKGFWIALGKVFGGKVNADVFAELAQKIELHHLAKLNYDQLDIEAYCFGLAGFLDSNEKRDDYFELLKEKYDYQKNLFHLQSLQAKSWKFSRMRPGSFPTIRLAQFAAILAETKGEYHFFETNKLNKLSIPLSPYWKKHHHFNKSSKQNHAGISPAFKALITINAFLPFLFAQGTIVNHSHLREKALEELRHVKPEYNSIIKQWKAHHVPVDNAFDSQALIEMKNEFCDHNKCLQCAIGVQLLKPKKEG
jgi:hypothetical protein